MNKKLPPQKKGKERKPRKLSGLTTEILNAQGKVVGEVELPKEIFAAKINEKLLAQAVRVYLANQRQGTVSTKTRGEVTGSTAKIYRQKGTGRARHGSHKAPIFVGGGVVFGPKPRDFSLKMPKKMKLQALFSGLTSKFQNKEILIIDNLEKIAAKTKEMIKILNNLRLEVIRGKLKTRTLLLNEKPQKNLLLATRNIHNLTIFPVNLLHPYLLLSHQKIIFTKEAIEKLNDLWKRAKS